MRLISILARASTSADAESDDTKWVTTDLAPYAAPTLPADRVGSRGRGRGQVRRLG